MIARQLRRLANRLDPPPKRTYPFRYKGMYDIRQPFELERGEIVGKMRAVGWGGYYHVWVYADTWRGKRHEVSA